jgi:hypothetical protein
MNAVAFVGAEEVFTARVVGPSSDRRFHQLGKISEPYSGGRKHASSHPAGKSTEKLALGESFAESPNNEKEREGSKKK